MEWHKSVPVRTNHHVCTAVGTLCRRARDQKHRNSHSWRCLGRRLCSTVWRSLVVLRKHAAAVLAVAVFAAFALMLLCQNPTPWLLRMLSSYSIRDSS